MDHFHYIRGLFRALRARKFQYQRLVEVTVSREAILHNLHTFEDLYGKGVAPVLKSNAYGHGLVETAKILRGERVPFLCVDSFFEALVLRNERITTPILIIGYTPLENLKKRPLKEVSFAVISLDELERLASSGLRVAIHLEVDTGMHRHGIMLNELDRALALLAKNPQIALEGIYTHLADADTSHSPHVARQITQWNAAAAEARKKIPSIRYFHCAQTAGSFYSSRIDANVIRIGIGLYGIYSGVGNISLRPALEMRTRITSLRTIEAGEYVGYNAAFKAEQRMRIASIPVGYHEGIDRRLSNRGFVTVSGIPCGIVGRVSMNITSIDVSRVPDAAIDKEVVVVSADPKDPNSIARMAEICGAIPYELLVHIPEGLRRTIKDA